VAGFEESASVPGRGDLWSPVEISRITVSLLLEEKVVEPRETG